MHPFYHANRQRCGIKMGTFVKKNKLNNSSKWFTFGQKIRPQFEAAVFCLHIMRINLFRNLQWLLSNATNNINQIAKATNTTGVIYKKDIDYMREKIEKLAKEIWDIHSLLLNKSKESSGDQYGNYKKEHPYARVFFE